MYKDFVKFLRSGDILTDQDLKKKVSSYFSYFIDLHVVVLLLYIACQRVHVVMILFSFIKGEPEFETDRLVEGGTLDGLFNGR